MIGLDANRADSGFPSARSRQRSRSVRLPISSEESGLVPHRINDSADAPKRRTENREHNRKHESGICNGENERREDCGQCTSKAQQ